MASWADKSGHTVILRLSGDQLGPRLPDNPENIATLRRFAEDHAGFELDWRGGRYGHEDYAKFLVLWCADAVDTYVSAAA
jgi:hypothetical protein